jgi:hypothetical protein
MNAEEVCHELEDALAPYGYYLAHGGDEKQLNLTGVEVGFAALGLLVWVLKGFADSFLKELGKASAKGRNCRLPEYARIFRSVRLTRPRLNFG